MKGLIRNNLYSAQNTLLITACLSSVIAIVALLECLINGHSDSLFMIIFFQFAMFLGLYGVSFQQDSVSKWNRFEITLPIKRSDVVKARYLSFLIYAVISLVCSILTIIVVLLTKVPINFERVGYSISFGIFSQLMTPAFMYPAILKLGYEKSDTIMMIAAAGSAFIFIFVSLVIGPFVPNGVDANLFFRIFGIIIAIIMFCLSYFVSLNIYRKKQL